MRANAAPEPTPALTSLSEAVARRPLAVACLALLLGIWLQDRLGFGWFIWAGVLLLLAPAVVGAALYRWPTSWALVALPVGALLHTLYTLPPADDVARFLTPGSVQQIRGVIEGDAALGGAARLVMSVRAVGERRAAGRVLLTVPRGTNPAPADEVVVTGIPGPVPQATNPGELDYGAVLQRRQVRGLVFAQEVEVVGRAPWWTGAGMARATGAARRRIITRLGQAMGEDPPGPETALLGSVVYGITAVRVSPAVARDFRDAGTIHLLVVSGAQVTMLLLLVTGQWQVAIGMRDRRRRLGRRWLLPALVVPLGFAVLVGLGPSVVRAACFVVLGLLALLTARDYDAATSFALTAAAICVADTNALFDLGAQLSFAGALGVLLVMGAAERRRHAAHRSVAELAEGGLVSPWRRAADWAKRWAADLARAQAAVWLLTTPLLAHQFSSFPLLGALANVVCIPAATVLLVLGVLATPLALVAPWLATPVCLLARGPIWVLTRTSALFAGLPLAQIRDLHLPAWACVLWYVLLVMAFVAWRVRWRPRPRQVVAGAAAAATLAAALTIGPLASRSLSLTVLDTDGGACAVLQVPGGANVMVDAGSGDYQGGGDLARRAIVPFLRREAAGRLDLLLVTHPHADHTNAIEALCQAIRPRAIRTWAEAAGGMRPSLRAGMTLDLGRGVVGEVLWPPEPLLAGTVNDLNNNSVVLRVRCGDRAVLFTGDLQADGELALISRGADVRADVLVVGHHGRPSATSLPFLLSVRPTHAIISSSRAIESYAPDGGALARLGQMGVRVWRTDQCGAVRVRIEGGQVRVEPFGRRAAA